jgi:hypothetical protein
MSHWWIGEPSEKYWCEITDRPDIGTDLKCPQSKAGGKEYWSYSLIRSVGPQDIVFHYSTKSMAFVGASVAGGPIEERQIEWAPHGTVGRSKKEARQPRPGWWLPLYRHTKIPVPLALKSLQDIGEQQWIRQWIEAKQQRGPAAAPFQLYPGKLRASQGYLTKMPRAFVSRWLALSTVADELERYASISDTQPPGLPTKALEIPPDSIPSSAFHPKSDADYVAVIRGGLQPRTRAHETLVRAAGEHLIARGASIATPHPLDLVLGDPVQVIFEAKICGAKNPGFAIREAIGQLQGYRHFVGPKSAEMCILLDRSPAQPWVEFVEQGLSMCLMWRTSSGFAGGPRTVDCLRINGRKLLD